MRPIDADALKQSVNECDVCNVCPERKARCSYDCEFPDYLTPKFEALIDAQPTIEPKKGEWIPCSERLPRGDVQVLVSVGVADAPWSIILMSASSVGEYYRRGYIDAWMPLPEPYDGADMRGKDDEDD